VALTGAEPKGTAAMRPQALIPLIAAALAFGASAAGASPSDAISIRVKISDLNLQSPAGAQVALRRISTAARLICGDESGVRDLKRQALGEACVRRTVTATVVAAHSPMLAALSGTPIPATALAAAD
jgi:UrcA family protein